MKKLLLSLAVAALAAGSALATTYKLFPGENLTWDGGTSGYTTTTVVEGKTFTIEIAKAKSTTNAAEPSADMIKVYKSSTITISSTDVDMKQVALKSSGGKYGNAQTVSTGWSGSYDTNTLYYTITNATGAKEMTMTASANQFRIVEIQISDEAGSAPVEPDPETVDNVSATIALDTDTPVLVNYNLTVGYVNYSNVFAVDEAGDFIQIYGPNEYKVGDVIPAGWNGTYKLHQGTTPEIVPNVLPEAQEGTFTPKTVAAADITNALVNNVVKIENVVLAEASPDTKDNFTGKVGETELSLRNNYTLPSVEAGTYNITVVVTIYKNAPRLYVTNFEEAKTPTGIDEIGVDANAPVEYYNLQGVRVANPENGIFIRRQGAKATKVFVK